MPRLKSFTYIEQHGHPYTLAKRHISILNCVCVCVWICIHVYIYIYNYIIYIICLYVNMYTWPWKEAHMLLPIQAHETSQLWWCNERVTSHVAHCSPMACRATIFEPDQGPEIKQNPNLPSELAWGLGHLPSICVCVCGSRYQLGA